MLPEELVYYWAELKYIIPFRKDTVIFFLH